MNLIEEFQQRATVLKNASYHDVTGRLVDILSWLEQQEPTNRIIAELKGAVNVEPLFSSERSRQRPQTNTRDEIAAVGLSLMEQCRAQTFPNLCFGYGMSPGYSTNSVQEY